MTRARFRAMRVKQLVEDLRTSRPRVVLADERGELAVPVSVADGPLLAPLLAPDYVVAARPELLPHRLLAEVATLGGLSLRRAELTVDEGALRATVELRKGKKSVRLPARPVDAIAWAAVEKLPLHVALAAFDERSAPRQAVADDAHTLMQILTDLHDDEFGKWKM